MKNNTGLDGIKKILFFGVIALQVLFLFAMMAQRQSILVFGKKIMLETIPVDPYDLFRGEYVVLNYRISRGSFVTDKPIEFQKTAYAILQEKAGFYEMVSITNAKPDKLPAGFAFIKGSLSSSIQQRVLYTLTNLRLIEHSSTLQQRELLKNCETLNDYLMSGSSTLSRGNSLYFVFGNIGSGEYWSYTDPEALYRLGIERIYIYTNYASLTNDIKNNPNAKVDIVSGTIDSVRFSNDVSLVYGIESYFMPEGEAIDVERIARQTKSDISRVTVEVAVTSEGDAAISRLFIDGKPIDLFTKNYKSEVR